MQKVIKAGNSKAVIIPNAYAKRLGLTEGALIDVRLVKDHLVLKPAKAKYTLEQLLAEMPEFCDEREMDFGNDVGEEIVVYEAQKDVENRKPGAQKG